MSSEDVADAAGRGAAAASARGDRPEQPEAFLRGAAFAGAGRIPYPRAEVMDRMRLPKDTWLMAQLPVGVRIEVVGDAHAVAIDYTTTTDNLGYRGAGAGNTFAAWVGTERVASVPAVLGEGTVELPLAGDEPTAVHLPEGMKPTITAVRGVGGQIAPAPRQPRWVVYGDSVAEGWVASEPGLAWPAIAGRALELDTFNLGYAGAARAEIASAEQVAKLPADVITICHGTNCWTRVPHSAAMFRAATEAFIDIVRDGHPTTPIVIASPVVRPDAEDTPNRLGATLADLRREMEEEALARIAAGDDRLALVRGLDLMTADQLGDGIHPDDDGHRAMAAGIGAAVTTLLG